MIFVLSVIFRLGLIKIFPFGPRQLEKGRYINLNITVSVLIKSINLIVELLLVLDPDYYTKTMDRKK